jgi:hypothetical protein
MKPVFRYSDEVGATPTNVLLALSLFVIAAFDIIERPTIYQRQHTLNIFFDLRERVPPLTFLNSVSSGLRGLDISRPAVRAKPDITASALVTEYVFVLMRHTPSIIFIAPEHEVGPFELVHL